jgi:hypothetical protein
MSNKWMDPDSIDTKIVTLFYAELIGLKQQ